LNFTPKTHPPLPPEISIVNNNESLLPDAGLFYIDNFLSSQKANALFYALKQEIVWQSPQIRMFGKWVNQPRLLAWQASGIFPYRYSGQTLQAEPFHPLIELLCLEINAFCQTKFNSVLLNYYRSGNDSMGWHSDNEPELGTNPIIASISLGAVRDFQLKQIHPPYSLKTYKLEQGSLLIMGENVQDLYKHALPKRAHAEPRINLTFREIKFT
jgi:alkylated DNA repair dioxygenase AlkB